MLRDDCTTVLRFSAYIRFDLSFRSLYVSRLVVSHMIQLYPCVLYHPPMLSDDHPSLMLLYNPEDSDAQHNSIFMDGQHDQDSATGHISCKSIKCPTRTHSTRRWVCSNLTTSSPKKITERPHRAPRWVPASSLSSSLLGSSKIGDGGRW